MAANGPRIMYSLKPYYNKESKIELPECLYKMKNYHSDSIVTQDEPKSSYELLAKRQEAILEKLEHLKQEVSRIRDEILGNSHLNEINAKPSLQLLSPTAQPAIPEDIVVSANPSCPPLSLWVLSKLLKKCYVNIRISVHIHSSVSNIPLILQELPNEVAEDRLNNHANVTVIWKEGGLNTEAIISPILQNSILGEVNVLRYLCRSFAPDLYESDPEKATEIDYWLDRNHFTLINGNNKERQSFIRQINSHLGRAAFLVGESLSLADISVFSSICQCKIDNVLPLPSNVTNWWKQLAAAADFSCILPYIQP